MSEQPAQSPKPVFYNNPKLLSRDEHQALKLVASSNYAFAQNVASVPVVISELAVASAHYPIVFVQGAKENGAEPRQPMAMALLSTVADRNDFVGEDGSWRADTYIPAYVRRYPFVFASDGSSDNLVLCADLSSDRLSEDNGEPLFTDGQPSETTSRVLTFCNDFQRDYAMTEQWIRKLVDMDLLTPQRLTITRTGKPSTVLDGLMLLDREKFRSLSDKQFIELRRGGCLGPIYAHLSSLHRLRQFV